MPHYLSFRRVNPDILSSWAPQPGDIIISNWVSWLEVLWLAARYNPIFVVPVFSPQSHQTTKEIGETGNRVTIIGYRTRTLFQMCRSTGYTPQISTDLTLEALPFHSIQASADRPIVMFPECTTSNGRAILRFSDSLLDVALPSKKFSVYIMCIK
jgi:hypothetical protein